MVWAKMAFLFQKTRIPKKNAVVLDVAPRGFTINRHFGGTCSPHLQGRRNNASEEKVRR
jgi:hypothetical protein